MTENIELSLFELLLDEDNPRLGSVGSQAEALQELIRLNDGHFRNLMLSIKEHGLDPGDSLYVIQKDDTEDFIVLEGNRRLCAMMVLDNPDLLSGTDISDSIKNSLTRASNGFEKNKIEPVRCVQFEKREDADEWIYRRHTGAADGEGRIQWGPLEVQRFSGDRSLLDVIDFVGRNAAFTDEEWASTKATIESKKSSNLSRLLDSKAGRDHLSLSVNKKEANTPMLGSKPDWAIKVLKRIIEDIRDGVIDSRSLNKASEIKEYFDALPKELQPSSKTKSKIQSLKDINIKTKKAAKTSSNPSTTKTKKTKTKGVTRSRRTLAPKRHTFKNPDSTKGKDLLREASFLDADKFKLSAAFVLRAFIELAVHDYMKKNKMPLAEKDKNGKDITLDLSTKSARVYQDILDSKLATPSDLRGFKSNILTKTSPTSIQSLSNFVHNKFQIPVSDALRSGWECSIPIFEAAFGEV